ncbi:hypothetical protein KCP70_05565 [Salmonella enterica subsp. enterica]|nr:hypothetical protein KCP70_05565 [Salmonella enterica subsp. enterica]
MRLTIPETLLTVPMSGWRDFDKPEGQTFLTLPVIAKKHHQNRWCCLWRTGCTLILNNTVNSAYHELRRSQT